MRRACRLLIIPILLSISLLMISVRGQGYSVTLCSYDGNLNRMTNIGDIVIKGSRYDLGSGVYCLFSQGNEQDSYSQIDFGGIPSFQLEGDPCRIGLVIGQYACSFNLRNGNSGLARNYGHPDHYPLEIRWETTGQLFVSPQYGNQTILTVKGHGTLSVYYKCRPHIDLSSSEENGKSTNKGCILADYRHADGHYEHLNLSYGRDLTLSSGLYTVSWSCDSSDYRIVGWKTSGGVLIEVPKQVCGGTNWVTRSLGGWVTANVTIVDDGWLKAIYASANIPNVVQIENLSQGTIGKIKLHVSHPAPTGSHFIDLVEVNVVGQVKSFILQAQNSDPFTVDLDLGQLQGTQNLKARVHCTVHGWSNWSSEVQVPEFSHMGATVLAALAAAFLITRRKTQRAR